MFDSPAARGQETCIDRASANPNFPCDLPSWNYSDVLNGLDQFMEMVPNFPIGSNGSGASEAGDQSYVGGHEALGPNATPAGLGKAEKEKRRQYKNKLAQKRFRERQRVGEGCVHVARLTLYALVPLTLHHLQAHSNDLEAQLKASSAQLEDMKQKQKALEARNIMLEKLIDLDKQGVSAATMSPAAVRSCHESCISCSCVCCCCWIISYSVQVWSLHCFMFEDGQLHPKSPSGQVGLLVQTCAAV